MDIQRLREVKTFLQGQRVIDSSTVRILIWTFWVQNLTRELKLRLSVVSLNSVVLWRPELPQICSFYCYLWSGQSQLQGGAWQKLALETGWGTTYPLPTGPGTGPHLCHAHVLAPKSLHQNQKRDHFALPPLCLPPSSTPSTAWSALQGE